MIKQTLLPLFSMMLLTLLVSACGNSAREEAQGAKEEAQDLVESAREGSMIKQRV